MLDNNEINYATYSHPLAIAEFTRYGLTDYEKRAISTFFKKGGYVLDVGCGCGRTTRPLWEMGYEVIGIDIVPEMIEVAKQNCPGINFRVMDASNLQFRDGSFDNVLFSFNGLDNIYPRKQRMRALMEIYRVLRHEGVFIFTAHNKLCITHNPLKKKGIFFSYGFLKYSLRNVFSDYRVERHFFGNLVIDYVNPLSQIRELKIVGFRKIKIMSRYSMNLPCVLFLDNFPLYIGQK